VALLLAQEYLLPYTNQLQGQVWRTRIQEQKRDARLGGFKQGALWYRADNRIWSVQQGEPLANRLLGVTLYVMDGAGSIHERYDAAWAAWDKMGWTLHDGVYRRFDAQGDFADLPVHFQRQHLALAESPKEISALEKEPNERSIRESLAYARQLRQQGLEDAYYMVEFHSKLAFSVVCIIMAGFGAPLALVSNRSGGVARAVALTLVCGFSYWIVNSLALAFGYNGQVPPVAAAWFGNMCFGMGSLYLAVRAH
jgi:lipopolysaccharide export system permease protein